MSDLDELRAKRLAELQRMQQANSFDQNAQEHMRAQEAEKQIKAIVSQVLSTEAQARLANIRIARPDFARQVEILLIQLYQAGRLSKMTDGQFKALLSKIKGSQRETKIEMR
jgi:programmed cell death protein 5